MINAIYEVTVVNIVITLYIYIHIRMNSSLLPIATGIHAAQHTWWRFIYRNYRQTKLRKMGYRARESLNLDWYISYNALCFSRILRHAKTWNFYTTPARAGRVCKRDRGRSLQFSSKAPRGSPPRKNHVPR